MTTSSSSERCGGHDENVVLSSSLDGNRPPLTTSWRECWLHAVYAPLRRIAAIGITAAVFRRALNARRIPSSTESSSLAKSSARAQDEIAVLLQQLILASIAAVRDGVREMLTAIDFDDDARIRA